MSGQHAERDLDNTNCSRGLWLVKIPKYMKDKWVECPGDVGRLRIHKIPGTLPAVTFASGEQILKDNKMAREHKFKLHSVKEMTLGVFSCTVPSGSSDSVVPEQEKLYMEGQVIQKFECQPVADSFYYNQKKAAAVIAAQPHHKQSLFPSLSRCINQFPNTKSILKWKRGKKAEGKKARDDKDKVMEMLFAAFEKHQYYNIKDLQKLTRQPITYLKEILKEVCDYNVKNPHRNMWELKPEYRHYKAEETAVDDPGSD